VKNGIQYLLNDFFKFNILPWIQEAKECQHKISTTRQGDPLMPLDMKEGMSYFFHKFKEGVGNSLILKPSHACQIRD